MNQKERLEEIHKRHEEIQYKRRIRMHRILLAAAAAAVLALLIIIITVSVNAISRNIEEKRAREAEIAAQATPSPSPKPKAIYIDPNVISEDYYANSAFIGNSFADDLYMYALLPDADFFARTGLSVDIALSGDDLYGPILDEFDNGKSYDRVFMMFGENEVGWPNPDMFTDDYGKLIDKVRKICPDCRVYLLSITPITQKASDENVDGTNNDNIRKSNKRIKALADKKDAVYADVYSAVVDKNGNLPANAATDGVHFGKDYYEKCLLYIQNNYK